MPLYAGVCETNITPPIGVWMCGYGLRPSGCLGIHDELYARALVLNDGRGWAVIVSMDLIGLDQEIVAAIRDGIAARCGIPTHAVMLNATHTHGGPNVRSFYTMGVQDKAYVDILVRKIIGVVQQAAYTMRPATLAHGRAPVQIGINRRQVTASGPTVIGHNYGGPVMPWVDVMAVRDLGGLPFAAVFSHACHPTTLGGDNLQITGDFCGFACERLRAETEGRVIPLFVQGCAGNINPIDRVTFAAAQHNGERLGAAAYDALLAATAHDFTDDVRLDCREETLELPVLPPPPVPECERRIEEWTRQIDVERATGHYGRVLHAEGMRDFAEYERRLAAEGAHTTQSFTIQRIAAGHIQFLGMPAETFVQYALDFDQQADGPVFTLAYTNGVHNYLPTTADYEYGGYEVDGAFRYYGQLMFARESEAMVRSACYELLGIRDPETTPYTV